MEKKESCGNKKLLDKNELNETENLRSAIYAYELKTISNLQFINGGGASVLVGFLSQIAITPKTKCYFALSIISFLLGLIFSVILSFISPRFLIARYEQNQKPDDYKKYERLRIFCLLTSLIFFVSAILLSMFGYFALSK